MYFVEEKKRALRTKIVEEGLGNNKNSYINSFFFRCCWFIAAAGDLREFLLFHSHFEYLIIQSSTHCYVVGALSSSSSLLCYCTRIVLVNLLQHGKTYRMCVCIAFRNGKIFYNGIQHVISYRWISLVEQREKLYTQHVTGVIAATATVVIVESLSNARAPLLFASEMNSLMKWKFRQFSSCQIAVVLCRHVVMARIELVLGFLHWRARFYASKLLGSAIIPLEATHPYHGRELALRKITRQQKGQRQPHSNWHI